MKRPLFLKAAPALAVLLALSSLPAHSATRRGGANSSENKAAAQSTAAQSAKQEGSLDSNSPAQGAARRARSRTFVNTASAGPVVVAKAVAATHRKLAAHIADVDTFVNQLMTLPYGQRPLGTSIVSDVKNQVLNGPSAERQFKIYALVDELSKTDEEALHAFFLLANYGNADTVRAVKPEFSSSLDRLKEKMKAKGISDFRISSPEEIWAPGWSISSETAHSVLAAPGARALLHKLTDSEAQKKKRETLAKERANILNVENAQGSLEMMQELKQYIKATLDESSVDLTMPMYFMNKLNENKFPISGNGGVILVFGSGMPMEIITEYGVISYYGGHHIPSLNQEALTKKLNEDLGLERIDVTPFPGLNRWKQYYAVTRLPDGTLIPKASQDSSLPASPGEIKLTVLKVSQDSHKDISIADEE